MFNACPVVPKFLGPPLFCLYLQGFMYEVRKSFTVGVSCSGELLGTGTAQRKKDAEQLAAREAMERIHLTLR